MNNNNPNKNGNTDSDPKQKIDTLIEKVENFESKMDQSLNEIRLLKEEVGTFRNELKNKNTQDNNSHKSENAKYKKILNIIDIIAMLVILFIIIDGVFNQFSWLYALSEYFSNLF